MASVTFHVALWHNLSPDYFERLRTQLLSFLHQLSFLRENKVIFEFNIYFCYIHIAVFTRLSLVVVCEAFFLGDEYIVYYIQGLTSPTTAARESTMVYLRVIIIWGLCEMLNFQYEKSDLCG